MATMGGTWTGRNKHLFLSECLRIWGEGSNGDFKTNPVLAGFKGHETMSQHIGDAIIGELEGSYSLDEIANWQTVDTTGGQRMHNFNGTLTDAGGIAYMSVAALWYAIWSKRIQTMVSDIAGYNIRELSLGWGDFASVFANSLSLGSSYTLHVPPQTVGLIEQYLSDSSLTGPTIEDFNNISTSIGGKEFFFSPFLYAELDSTGRQWWRDNILVNANAYLIIASPTLDTSTIESELSGMTGWNTQTAQDDPIYTALGLTAPRLIFATKPYVESGFTTPISIASTQATTFTLDNMPAGFTLDDITCAGSSLASQTKLSDTQVRGRANSPERSGVVTISFNSGSSVVSTDSLAIVA